MTAERAARSSPQVVDLNADLGESFGVYRYGADDELLPLLSSANVACGFHGGDPSVMRRTVALARRHGVAVGAHVGFPDLLGFSRRRGRIPSPVRCLSTPRVVDILRVRLCVRSAQLDSRGRP
jgi:UPF0271 protein